MDTFSELLDRNGFIPVFLFGVGMIIAIVGIFCGSAISIVRTRAREHSRREIAAYIAEGSMSSNEGERLMAAGEKNG